MTTSVRVRVRAYAKLNWSLEVLRARPDGYHEIRSVLQTITLCDVITVEAAGEISLELRGEADMLEDNPPSHNLAYRAAVALRERARNREGARITLEKHIPVAAGLGGGSSDAAAVLRALNLLWGTKEHDANLLEIAGEVGSDPPFFIAGGTAIASGRGEVVEPLPDASAPRVMLAIPPIGERGEKTAQMFAALEPHHYSEGDATLGIRETIVGGRPIRDELLANVFEHVTAAMQPDTWRAMNVLREEGYEPHLCGAGPSFFLLSSGGGDDDGVLARRIEATGFDAVPAETVGRATATATEVA